MVGYRVGLDRVVEGSTGCLMEDKMDYQELAQIEARWSPDDQGWRRPGHKAACTDIMLLAKALRQAWLEAERQRRRVRA